MEALIEAGFNFRQMATILGVTIGLRREFFGLPVFSDISDYELDVIVAGILQVSSSHTC